MKAKEGSNAFNELRLASRVVSEATGRVVAVAKDSSATAESEYIIVFAFVFSFEFDCHSSAVYHS